MPDVHLQESDTDRMDGCLSGRKERLAKPSSAEPRSEGSNPSPSVQTWPKLIWVCDHCGHWHGASYARWPEGKPPTCKIKGYGRDGKNACGRVMRPVWVNPR